MATFTFGLFDTPESEVRRLFTGSRPQWVDRILSSRNVKSTEVPVSVALEALGEGLEHRLQLAATVARAAERHGWSVELGERGVRITTAASSAAAVETMERDGVWHLAQRLAGGVGAEEVLR